VLQHPTYFARLCANPFLISFLCLNLSRLSYVLLFFLYLNLSFLNYVPKFGNDAMFVLPRHFQITQFLRNSLHWSLIVSRGTVMAFALWDSLSPSLLPAYFGPWPADGLRRTEVAFWPRTCALVCVECCITSPGLYCTNGEIWSDTLTVALCCLRIQETLLSLWYHETAS
jgi:hypothetical protein